MAEKSKKVFTTMQEVKDFLGFSDKLLDYWRARGLPIVIAGQRCYAHADNLEEFFRIITRKKADIGDDDITDE